MIPQPLSTLSPEVRRYADVVLAALVVLMVGMMIVPLPTAVLDLLLASNLSMAVVMLLAAVYISDALSLSAFPTVLLVTTLYRLALNVSSTRLILLQADAGEVIDAFGEFVVRGNYVVGAVVFLILTLVQFLVVAKGSERVAEVGARFTLDAMPGKQMSIDADLRSGSVTQDEARELRRTLQRESQFYGAMDGAMKFVKGDAIAGIVITAINILGGLAIGVTVRDMSVAESLTTYGLLTIGDGLVSQIPAILISTSAGLVVTRVASKEESSLGADIAMQVLGNQRALSLAAVFISLLAIVPGLPTLPFLVLGGVLWFGARGALALPWRGRPAGEPLAQAEHGTRAVPSPSPVVVELGELAAKRLSRDGLNVFQTREVPRVQEALLWELGVSIPPVGVRTSSGLGRDEYRIQVYEVPCASGRVDLTQKSTADEEAQLLERALQTSLRRRARDFVGLQETQSMLDALERTHPALVRNVVPKPVSLALLTGVLRRLVDEQISIRPLRDILEALAVFGPGEQDAARLTELVRTALRRHITHKFARGSRLDAFTVDPTIEDAVRDSIKMTTRGNEIAMAPEMASDVIRAVQTAVQKATQHERVVLLCQSDVRHAMRQLIEVHFPDAVVLSYSELSPETTIHNAGRIEVSE